MKKYSRAVVLFIAIVTTIALFSCNNPSGTAESDKPESLSVYFLELGNQYVGDCVFIDYGDTEIIIDAGSKFTSAATIRGYIDKHIGDDKIEYVIATHAHEDHIAAFGDHRDNNNKGILSSYSIGTIIDFPKTVDPETPDHSNYKHYLLSRDAAVAKGAKHYTALECYNETGGAKRTYELGGDARLEILYNYYYDHTSPDDDENHTSVCVMLYYGDQQYLFTGDMEKEGEEKLVEHYAALRGGLGHCELFKGAHHGSNTSNTAALLDAITPDYVCICTCCGTSQYTPNKGGQFPTQDTIDAIAKHTENVFATTLVTVFDKDTLSNSEYQSMNGNIQFTAAESGKITVHGSNNSTLLKDTEWFSKNREMPDSWK